LITEQNLKTDTETYARAIFHNASDLRQRFITTRERRFIEKRTSTKQPKSVPYILSIWVILPVH